MITLLLGILIFTILITVSVVILSIGGTIILVFGTDILIAGFVLWLIFGRRKKIKK